MGYTTSKRAVKRVETYLNAMVASETNIEWTATDPAKLAYYIREGISVAKQTVYNSETPLDNEPYTSYARLASKYIIKVLSGKVAAQLRDVIPLPASLSTMVIPDITDELGIVGAMIKHKARRAHFPDAFADSINLDRLYAWTSKNNYHIISSNLGIIITRSDPEGLAWIPF